MYVIIQCSNCIYYNFQGDNGILRKKFKSLQNEIDAQKVKQEDMEGEQRKLQGYIKSVEKELLNARKEIEVLYCLKL